MKEMSNYPADVAPVVFYFSIKQSLTAIRVLRHRYYFDGWKDRWFHITSERTPGPISKEGEVKGRVCEALQSRVCHFFLRVFSDVSHTWRPHRCREHLQAISKSQPKSSSERIRSSINTPAAGIRPGQAC